MSDLTNLIKNANAAARELSENYGFQTEVVPNPTFTQIAEKITDYQRKYDTGAYDQKDSFLSNKRSQDKRH